MKPHAIRLIICSLLFPLLASCDEPPEKPTVMLCVIDVESAECICGTKAPNKNVSDLRREPMVFCDKATAFRPQDWEKYKNYVDGLEDFIARLRAKKN